MQAISAWTSEPKPRLACAGALLQDRINTSKINNLRCRTPVGRQKHRSTAQRVADKQQKPEKAGFCLCTVMGSQPWLPERRSRAAVPFAIVGEMA